MSTRDEAEEIFNASIEGNIQDYRALVGNIAAALDARDHRASDLKAKLVDAAEQRAREAEVKGLEKAASITVLLRGQTAGQVYDAINTEIVRLSKEKL